jgi:hypothetical protein
MATNIEHTLFNLEVPPPPGVWPGIAARLNSEFDASETTVGQKMYDLSVMPPPSAWQEIAAALPQQQTIKKEGKIRVLPVTKAISAAAAMVLLTMAAWYFLDNSNNKRNTSVVQQTLTIPGAEKNAPAQKTDVAVTEHNDEPRTILAEKSSPLPPPVESSMVTRYTNRHNNRRINYYAYSDYQPVATSYAGIDDVQAVSFTNDNLPSVEAPLIRDANGQIILDKKLITSPDDCYITITGPNGEQTRISSKFVHIISSLNDDTQPQDYFDFMMQENSLWKMRFREWKDKLLNQASFVPVTGFTDILELKDMLMQENQ